MVGPLGLTVGERQEAAERVDGVIRVLVDHVQLGFGLGTVFVGDGIVFLQVFVVSALENETELKGGVGLVGIRRQGLLKIGDRLINGLVMGIDEAEVLVKHAEDLVLLSPVPLCLVLHHGGHLAGLDLGDRLLSKIAPVLGQRIVSRPGQTMAFESRPVKKCDRFNALRRTGKKFLGPVEQIGGVVTLPGRSKLLELILRNGLMHVRRVLSLGILIEVFLRNISFLGQVLFVVPGGVKIGFRIFGLGLRHHDRRPRKEQDCGHHNS